MGYGLSRLNSVSYLYNLVQEYTYFYGRIGNGKCIAKEHYETIP